MKKVVFFSNNMNIGGMEKALVNLLNELIKAYEVTLVLENKSGVLLEKLDKRVIVEEYNLSKKENVLIRKIENFSKRFIWTIKNKNKYDFSCNYATYMPYGSKLAQIASKNSSLYIHSNYFEMYKRNEENVKSFFRSHNLSGFNKLICVSNESCLGLKKIFSTISDKFLVLGNIIDYERILSLSKKKVDIEFSSDYINFIFIGRLENESKNLDLLLDVFGKVIREKNNIRLYIVGNGDYYQNIKDKINTLDLVDNVILLGQQINPYALLLKSDCFILTSNYEGFPVTYYECLVLDKPFMSTIMCSDDSIDIRDFAIFLEKDIDDIRKKILGFEKGKSHYDIDFRSINDKRVASIERLIESDSICKK